MWRRDKFFWKSKVCGLWTTKETCDEYSSSYGGIDSTPELAADRVRPRWPQLGQEQHDQLFLRIDEERRRRGAAPVILAGRADDLGDRRIQQAPRIRGRSPCPRDRSSPVCWPTVARSLPPGRWFSVINSNVRGPRIRTPSSSPPFSSILQNRSSNRPRWRRCRPRRRNMCAGGYSRCRADRRRAGSAGVPRCGA